MISPMYFSRARRNLNSILKQLSKPTEPDFYLVQKRTTETTCVLLSLESYQELIEIKAAMGCLDSSSAYIEELKKYVPTCKSHFTPYVRLIDIPNPWRSEFFLMPAGWHVQ